MIEKRIQNDYIYVCIFSSGENDFFHFFHLLKKLIKNIYSIKNSQKLSKKKQKF